MSHRAVHRLKGVARVWFGGQEIPGVNGFDFTRGTDTIRLDAGDSLDPIATDIVGYNTTGTFTARLTSPDDVALAAGTTPDASGYIFAEQSFTFSTSVSLTNTPLLADAVSVWGEGEYKELFTEVASDPAVGEFTCNDTTGELTFNAEESGTGYAKYVYYTMSGAKTGYVDNNTVADYKALIVAVYAGNQASDTSNDYVIYRLPRVKVTDIALSAGLKEYSTVTYSFEANPDASGRTLYVGAVTT